MKIHNVLTCLGVSSLLTISLASASFIDVSTTNVNYDAIAYVQAHGIVSGYADGTFKADRLINRAEFLKIIVEAIEDKSRINNCKGSGTSFSLGGPFSDVPATAWFAKYTCAATSHGIFNPISGYPDGTFRPGNNISFVEAAKILVRYKQSQLEESNVSNGITEYNDPYDVAVEAEYADLWYAKPVTYLGEKNSIPTSITQFSQNITRGEMAEMIYRILAEINTKPSQTLTSLVALNVSDFPTTQFVVPAGYEMVDSELLDNSILVKKTSNGLIYAMSKTTGGLTVFSRDDTKTQLSLMASSSTSKELKTYNSVTSGDRKLLCIVTLDAVVTADAQELQIANPTNVDCLVYNKAEDTLLPTKISMADSLSKLGINLDEVSMEYDGLNNRIIAFHGGYGDFVHTMRGDFAYSEAPFGTINLNDGSVLVRKAAVKNPDSATVYKDGKGGYAVLNYINLNVENPNALAPSMFLLYNAKTNVQTEVQNPKGIFKLIDNGVIELVSFTSSEAIFKNLEGNFKVTFSNGEVVKMVKY